MTGGGGGSLGLQEPKSGFSTTGNDCKGVAVLVTGSVVDLGVCKHLVDSNEDDRYFTGSVGGVLEGGTTVGGKTASVFSLTLGGAGAAAGTSGTLGSGWARAAFPELSSEDF